VPARTRRVKKKPTYISYAEFREAAGASGCACSGTGGEMMSELAILAARQMPGEAPAELFDQLLSQNEGAPVHGVWHHLLVGEFLLVCLRNAGYPVSEELIDEVIDRGRQIPGGACGFLGTCGALASAASAYAILLGATPVAVEARERLLQFQARMQLRLASIGGSRCCKKSSYVALELAREALAEIGFELPKEEFSGRCRYVADNDTCDGVECPYFPLAT
jgi:hypothetical protein